MTTSKLDERLHTEELKVSGEELLARIKEIVREGNARRIVVKDDEGHSLLEIPLSVGVVSAVLLPVWVALGAIAALAKHYTLEVIRPADRDEEC